jgi:putative ABC transport system permease protein
MIFDYFKLSVGSLRRRRVRSWLTMVGIFIGIAAVVSLISISQGMQEAINQQFQKIGSNRIMIRPGGGSFTQLGSAMTTGKLTESDVDLVRKVDGVEFSTGVLSKIARVEFNEQVKYVTVFGVATDSSTGKYISEVGLFDIENGRQLKSTDKHAAVVGYNVAEDMFDKKIGIGSKVKIEGEYFEVVGTQKKVGTGVHDAIIRIPLDNARTLLEEPEEFSTIFVKVATGFEPAEVGDKIRAEMRKDRDLKKGEEDFNVQTAEQVVGTFKSVLAMVQVFLIGIAAISLIVGGIGIMNTMYTSVLLCP